MNSLTQYKISQLVGITMVSLYACIALFTSRMDTRPETFPFFDWSLFSISTTPRTDVVVRIRSINEQLLPTPRFYYNMPDIFIHAKQRDINAWKTLQALRGALRDNNEERAEQLRHFFEQRYLVEAHDAEYDVVLLMYDPVARLRTGAIQNMTILASYKKGT
jgi:hypothetical protein